jgi:hypothetical protein
VPPRVKESPAPEEDERSWFVNELALQKTTRHPDDPVDMPGLHLLRARSYSEAQPMDASGSGSDDNDG